MNETPDEPRPPEEDAGREAPTDPVGEPRTTDGPPMAPVAQPPHEEPTHQTFGDLPPLAPPHSAPLSAPLADEIDEGAGRGRRRGGRLVAVAVAAVVLLGGGAAFALGGGDDGDGGSDGVATVDGSDGDQAASDDEGGGNSGPPDQSEMQDAMLEYAECMRDHGIDMPDPEFKSDGSGGGMVIQREGPDGGGAPVEGEEFEAANEECGQIMEEVRGDMPQLSPEEIAEMQDKLVDMAQCMRDKGYDMPDPQVNGDGGVQIEMRGGGPDSGPAGEGDPRNDQFVEDHEECSEQAGLENGPMGRRGGPAGGADDDGGSST